MPDEQDRIPTWRDFPDFYDNPVIQRIADNQCWTVSDQNKKPIDMYHLMHEWNGRLWGATYDKGYNPLVDLKTLCDVIPHAVNNAYYLDCLRDGIVVMDIEPSCPEKLKEQFMRLPYLYGERSMSGKGLHLVFELPDDILEKYPDAKTKQAFKHDSGYYEILLNHMVTFTRNVLPKTEPTLTEQDFRNIFDLLASQQKPTIRGEKIDMDELTDTTKIPKYDSIMLYLRSRQYPKTKANFLKKDGKPDSSRYEFGLAGFYYGVLRRGLKSPNFKGETYTDDMLATIVYNRILEVIEERGEHRAKHEESRNGLPWLLFVVTDLIAKNNAEEELKKQKKG